MTDMISTLTDPIFLMSVLVSVAYSQHCSRSPCPIWKEAT